MEDERSKLIEQVLTLRRAFSRAARPARDWLAVDLTLPQVKVLYLLYSARRLSMRPLAEGLGVTKNELVVPLAVLATEGRIRTERSGRATLYYPALELVARPRQAPPKGRATTPGRRTAADVAALTARLNELIRARPGLRIEEIARALGESTMVLSLPAKKLIVAGAIETRGRKRATRYFPR